MEIASRQIKANMIFKVSRLSVAELVKTFAQLLGTEGPPSSSVQGWVPCFFFTHENQNTEKDGGEKKFPVPSKRRILNLSFTSLGGEEEISFINEILLTLLSYEYFWMILRFMAYSCESL